MRRVFLFAGLVCVLLLPGLRAADPAPTIEIKMKSIQEMLPLAGYLGELVDQAEQAEQGAKFIEALAGKKGVIEGLDITKPFGAYASMTPAVIDSPILVLLPIGDEKGFLNLLRGKLNLTPEKGEDDIYSLQVPNVPPTVYFKFHQGYAYATIHNKQALDAKSILAPATFFANAGSSLASVAINVDSIPADVRKTVLGQMELKLNDAKAQPAKTKAEGKFRDLTIDAGFATIATILNEGKTAKLDFTVEPKTDELSLAFSLTAKDSTELKSIFAESAKRTSVVPRAISPNAILSTSLNLKLPESFKKRLSEALDVLTAEALLKAKPDDRPILAKIISAIEPTLKLGIVELSGQLHEAATPKKYEILSAMRVAEGSRMPTALKDVVPMLPKEIAPKLEVEKLGSGHLHEWTPPPSEDFTRQFGAGKMWFATSDDLLVMGLSEKPDATKALAAGSPVAMSVMTFEASLSRILTIDTKQTKPELVKAVASELFPDGKLAGQDTIKATITTGEKLDIRVTAKGKGIRFVTKLQAKQKDS